MAIAERIDLSAVRPASPRKEFAGPVRVIPNTRPLLFAGGMLFCSQFDNIVATMDLGESFQPVCKLTIPWSYRLARFSTLAQRISRCQVYRMRLLQDGTAVYVFRRGVYVQRPGERVATIAFRTPRGSRPVSLAVGRDDRIVFGEYFRNAMRDEVHIYSSTDQGRSWQVVHTFQQGSIRHVHGVSFDPWLDGYWICTGDEGRENQLLFASSDFQETRVLRRGGQRNRFYSLQVKQDVLLTATDSPTEQNFILAIDKLTGAAASLASIENTNFYSCQIGDDFVFSTNAEPSLLNDTRACHLWRGNPEEGFRRINSLDVDGWERMSQRGWVQSGLFQYPRVFFPEGVNPTDHLVCQTLGLRPHAGAMLVYEPCLSIATEQGDDRQAA